MTPDHFRRGAPGTAVHFTTAPTELGTLLVAATERGVCAVTRHDAPGDAEADLRADFPGADLTRDDQALAEAVHAILDHVGGAPRPDLPLDLRATAFQRRVWEALQAIPRGETRTYGDVAAAIGAPSAVRAVAGACAANPVALVTPCHRVVRTGGGISGYRWGVERKRTLLDREGPAD